MICIARYPSPVGALLLAARDDALIGLWISGQKHYPDALIKEAREAEAPVLAQAKDWLDRYFAGGQPKADELALASGGSAYQGRVWALLRAIPYGETTSYGALAAKLAEDTGDKRMSARAVGGAVGRNPISIIIPCHRVLGADGGLTGYAGGIAVKRWLLEHEKRAAHPFEE